MIALCGLALAHAVVGRRLSPYSAKGDLAEYAVLGAYGRDQGVAAWSEAMGRGDYRLLTRTRAASGEWSKASILSTTGSSALFSALAATRTGAAAVTWETVASGYESGGFVVDVSLRSGPRADWRRTSFSEPGVTEFDPQVAMASGGRTIVVWSAGLPDGDFAIQDATCDWHSGTCGAPQTLAGASHWLLTPQVVIGSGGEDVVAWKSVTQLDRVAHGPSGSIFAVVREPGAKRWGPAVKLGAEEDAGYQRTGTAQPTPQLAIGPHGRAALVWQAPVGRGIGLHYATLAGSRWHRGGLVRGASNALWPKLSANSAGQATLAWNSTVNTTTVVKSSEFDIDRTRWPRPVTVASSRSGLSPPAVFAGPAGQATLSWSTDGGSLHLVFRASAAHRWQRLPNLGTEGAGGPPVAIEPDRHGLAIWSQPVSTTDGRAQVYLAAARIKL